MSYNLIISENAEKQLDKLIGYVVLHLRNKTAARSILLEIEDAYGKLTESGDVYALCSDPVLAGRGYRKYILKRHEYVIVYKIDGDDLEISGVFHMRENYAEKL